MPIKIPDMLTPGEIVADQPANLRLLPEHLARHIFVAGGSGNGKSKLLELLCRQLINKGWGFTFIDPHGDCVDAVMTHLAAMNVDGARVRHLRPGPERFFSFDPFSGLTDGPAISYEGRLDSAVDRVVRAFLRNVALADQEVMKRLRRWLKNVLTVCAIDVGGGQHLGIAHALLLTNPKRPEFAQILQRAAPALQRLKPDVFFDFMELQECKSDSTRNTLIESTVNCLRDVLGSSVRALFGQHARSLDLKDAILNRRIQLVNLRETEDFSRDQGNVIGGLLINFLISTARKLGDTLPPERRVPHYIIIDEAENFIGEDIRMGFAELRKFGLSLCLAVQDLSCLRRGDLDLVNKVVSQCGLQMTFQQQSPEDIEYLGKAFGYGALDMTPLMVNEVLPDGYDKTITKSVSAGTNWQQTKSSSESITRSQGASYQRQTGDSINEQVAETLSASRSFGESESYGESESENYSRTDGESHGTSEGRQSSRGQSDSRGSSEGTTQDKRGAKMSGNKGTSKGASTTRSDSESQSRTDSTSQSETSGIGNTRSSTFGTSRGETDGESTSVSHGRGRSSGESVGASESESSGESIGRSAAEGGSSGVSYNETWRARHKITEKFSGRLVMSVQDQLYAIMNRLASLPDRMVLVKCRGMASPFLLRVHEVVEAYEEKRRRENKRVPYSPVWKANDLQKLYERVFASHTFYFVPKAGDTQTALASYLAGPTGAKPPPSQPGTRPNPMNPAMPPQDCGAPPRSPFQDDE